MANELKMAIIQAIQRLHALRWSNRRIARELGIDRGTVGRYVRSIQSDSNAAIPPAGCPAPKAATFPGVPAPPAERAGNNDSAEVGRISKPAISPAGMGGPRHVSPGRPSHCEPFREVIQAAFEAGLSAQRIVSFPQGCNFLSLRARAGGAARGWWDGWRGSSRGARRRGGKRPAGRVAAAW